ncbi:2-keto-3-deoxygluconate permease [Arthrobacter sp. Bz4]|uniref:2-keto-3-deoxygluconate permease n=1 Tax=Arthrobacter sp. Bz4 TaxID=2171979 RepID=UPI001FAFDB3E|nr:2-keto-3-deoxygluconate permease [Arthrobacter sp. Bz4]
MDRGHAPGSEHCDPVLRLRPRHRHQPRQRPHRRSFGHLCRHRGDSDHRRLVYFGYRFILRRGNKAGIGIASATTAGNSIATPAVVAAADPTFAPFVEVATAQVASAVLVTAIFAPLLATWVLKRQGGLYGEDDAPDGDEHAAAAPHDDGRPAGTHNSPQADP